MTDSNRAKRVQNETSTKFHRSEKRPGFGRSTAYHEAGHAVAAAGLGIRVQFVSLRPDKSRGELDWYSKGQTTFQTFQPDENLFGNEAVIVLLAGAAAQKKHAPSSMRRVSAIGDRKRAELLVFGGVKSEAAEHALLQRRWDWLLAETTKLIEANWSVIDAVASRLLAAGEISGSEVTKIFREFRGVRKRLPIGP